MKVWPVLESLPEQERRALLSSARRRRFGRREVLFHEGDPGETMHLIEKGRVAVRITAPLGDVATVGVLGPGEVVGEMALLGQSPRRTATVVALERTETLSIDREQFLQLRRTHPAMDRFLVEVLAERLRRMDAHLLEALYLPVDRRVLRRLLSLAHIYGDAASGTEIPLTQEDLASLAGTSRATVNRVLREAAHSGAVELARGRIRILDSDKLARRAR